jgi:integrase
LNPDSQLVFEGMKKGRPLSDMTFTEFLRTAGLGDKATAHGFRSSFKNWCSEAKAVRDEVSEAALAHTMKDRVKAAYLRIDFLEERKLLMASWAAYCQCGGRTSSNHDRKQPHISGTSVIRLHAT